MQAPHRDPFDGRKVFSYEEANALVPRLEIVVPAIQRGYEELRRLLGQQGLEIDSPTLYREVHRDPGIRQVVDGIAAGIQELEDMGAVFQGPELGLVDFPSFHEGKAVLLCWQYGEKRIEWFHAVDEGFAGRRRLPNVGRPLRYD